MIHKVFYGRLRCLKLSFHPQLSSSYQNKKKSILSHGTYLMSQMPLSVESLSIPSSLGIRKITLKNEAGKKKERIEGSKAGKEIRINLK